MKTNKQTRYYLVSIWTDRIVERFSLNNSDAEDDETLCSQVCCVFGYDFDGYAIDKADAADTSEFPSIDEFVNLY